MTKNNNTLFRLNIRSHSSAPFRKNMSMSSNRFPSASRHSNLCRSKKCLKKPYNTPAPYSSPSHQHRSNTIPHHSRRCRSGKAGLTICNTLVYSDWPPHKQKRNQNSRSKSIFPKQRNDRKDSDNYWSICKKPFLMDKTFQHTLCPAMFPMRTLPQNFYTATRYPSANRIVQPHSSMHTETVGLHHTDRISLPYRRERLLDSTHRRFPNNSPPNTPHTLNERK